MLDFSERVRGTTYIRILEEKWWQNDRVWDSKTPVLIWLSGEICIQKICMIEILKNILYSVALKEMVRDQANCATFPFIVWRICLTGISLAVLYYSDFCLVLFFCLSISLHITNKKLKLSEFAFGTEMLLTLYENGFNF